jgi:hypothetical protein
VRRLPPWTLAAALGVAYLLLDPRTSDLAAQEYRAGLWARNGFTVWDNGWYAGHHVPAYSLLFPPLGAWLGAQVVGVLSAVTGTWAFGRLVGSEHRLAGYWTALAMATLLVTGRLTFALGVALGVAALAAARSAHREDGEPGAPAARRPPPDALLRAALRGRAAVGLAALCSAASPVAGVFLALAVAAWWLGDRTARGRRLIGVGVASVAPAAILALLFPEGGTFGFALSSFWPSLAGTLLVLAVLPRDRRVLRAGAALTALMLVGSWVLPTPMGGNAVRLGALFAGPALAVALLPRRRARTLALVAPVLLALQLYAPADDWIQSAHDPSVQPSAYRGLKRFLHAQGGPPFRVEIPFTDNHWESENLAGGPDGFPLARGWERQYDRKVNTLFYDGHPLTAARYRRWLGENAVRFVALADAPIDYSAAAEAQLIRDGLPYLRRAYRDRVWTVWEVIGARPLGVRRLTTDGFSTAAGGAVRIRWSPYFQVMAGTGCVRRSPDGFTAVDGALTVRAQPSLAGALRRTEDCHRSGRPRP